MEQEPPFNQTTDGGRKDFKIASGKKPPKKRSFFSVQTLILAV